MDTTLCVWWDVNEPAPKSPGTTLWKSYFRFSILLQNHVLKRTVGVQFTPEVNRTLVYTHAQQLHNRLLRSDVICILSTDLVTLLYIYFLMPIHYVSLWLQPTSVDNFSKSSLSFMQLDWVWFWTNPSLHKVSRSPINIYCNQLNNTKRITEDLVGFFLKQ
jgi:hypothetical protein